MEKKKQFNDNTVTIINIENVLFWDSRALSMRCYLNPHYRWRKQASWCDLLKDTELESDACWAQTHVALPPESLVWNPTWHCLLLCCCSSIIYFLSPSVVNTFTNTMLFYLYNKQSWFNYACVFNEKNKFQRDYIITSNRAESQTVGVTSHA